MSNAVRLGCGAGRMYRSVELTTLGDRDIEGDIKWH